MTYFPGTYSQTVIGLINEAGIRTLSTNKGLVVYCHRSSELNLVLAFLGADNGQRRKQLDNRQEPNQLDLTEISIDVA